MKKNFTLCFVLLPIMLLAQGTKFGATIGATNYISDTNYLFSKSGTGFTVGLMVNRQYNDRSSLILEINYNEHHFKLTGRENEQSTPEYIKFKLPEFSIPLIYNYNYLLLDDFKLGVSAGPSLHFMHDILLVDESKAGYLLDPFGVFPHELQFDTYSSKGDISFNLFLALGLSAQYKDNIMANLRYYYGITDPYRRSPVYSTVVDISGKDSYFSLTITYFF